MEILKFTTAGSIDDGKSTLIGRLLYDTNNIPSDLIMELLSTDAEEINLAHITDGLRSERQRGITIDVAYKYFSTCYRKYIITDAPGHIQYTKNIVSGASNVDIMIILVDAKNGITAQTLRHSLIASFLELKQVIVAINKMDLIDYSETIFNQLRTEYLEKTERLKISSIFIPICALNGDNVTKLSINMPWYTGYTLLENLEKFDLTTKKTDNLQIIVQNEIELNDNRKFYLAKVISGTLHVNDSIINIQKKQEIDVKQIVFGCEEVSIAYSNQNIALAFDSTVNLNRGDILSSSVSDHVLTTEFEAVVCWLDTTEHLHLNSAYSLKVGSFEVKCMVTKILHKISPSTFCEIICNQVLANEFAKIVVHTDFPVCFNVFFNTPELKRGILINLVANTTSAAIVIG